MGRRGHAVIRRQVVRARFAAGLIGVGRGRIASRRVAVFGLDRGIRSVAQ